MSQIQLRGDKKELQYRKTGFVGGSKHNSSGHQQRQHSSGTGNGTASSVSSAPSSNRSFKKTQNAQGGQSRVNSGPVNTSRDPYPVSDARYVENGGHVQSAASGSSHKPTAVPKSADASSNCSQAASKVSFSQPPSLISDSPTPSEGDASKGFSLQFGSINPGLMNVKQVPARTSSAPPNLVEQQRNQASSAASKVTPAIPVPFVPKQQMPESDVSTHQLNFQETRTILKTSNDVQMASVPLHMQPQRPSVLPVAGISLPMQYPQLNVPIQFGGPSPQIQSQGMPVNSVQRPMHMPLHMGNLPQIQQPVFVPGLQHHLIPNQGIIHQGQNFGFNPQLGPQVPHQLGNLGMNMPPHFNQHQAGKFADVRKTVKITHPETHEELRLDDKELGTQMNQIGHIQSQPTTTSNVTYTVTVKPNVGATTERGNSNPLDISRPAIEAGVSGRDMESSRSSLPSLSKSSAESSGHLQNSSKTDSIMVRERDNLFKVSVPESAGAEVMSSPLRSEGSTSVKAAKSDSTSSDHQAEKKIGKELHSTEASQAGTTITSGGCVTSNPVSPVNKTDLIHCKDIFIDKSSASNTKETHVRSNLSKADVVQVTESTRPTSSLVIVSGSNKTSVEANKIKNNRGKKKRKEMLQKAEALGTTTDLYMVYKGLEANKDSVVAEGGVTDRCAKDLSADPRPNCSPTKKEELNKVELEDWEDVADGSTPKLESSQKQKYQGLQCDDGVMAKKYSRDFLLTISAHCTELPEAFEITSDIAGLMVKFNANFSPEYSGPVRNERSGGAVRVDRAGNGVMETDKWGKPNSHLSSRDPNADFAYIGTMMGLRPGYVTSNGVLRPGGQGPAQHASGFAPGLMHPMMYQGMQRKNPEVDRWQRATNFNKGLMASPQTQLPAMHRAERKYEVGKVSDEEQVKQRRLKAILNKLTPQNFEKLFEQVQEVNIDNVVTLTGVISQLFDKALMEPTFCEMYANFCSHLASELPDLSVDNQKITFKRLLLNKCQEEFERGEREEEEANKEEDDGDNKQSDQEREEKRLKARRRMLGNIRLIGELYKKSMLTERIMHECMKKLLGQPGNVDEENIEALCKLMSTIGEMIDHSKSKVHMDAYFDIMGQLSDNMELSSRVRFMLKDTVDLRKNRWQQRRKVEGPKKIDEVHRDAAQERLGQASRLNRGSNMNPPMRRAQTLDHAPRVSTLPSPAGKFGGYRGPVTQFHGHGGKDTRMFDKSGFENSTPSVPLLQRSSGEPIMLGPQGGLARGMSCRGRPSASSVLPVDNSSSHDTSKGTGGLNGFIVDRGAHNSGGHQGSSVQVACDQSRSQEVDSSHESRDLRNSDGSINSCMPTSLLASPAGESPSKNLSSQKVYSEECLRDKSIAAIREYYSAKDEKEVELCIKELNAPSFYPTAISIWVTDAFERKDLERQMLTKLLIHLTKPSEISFSSQQFIEGFETVLTTFEDIVTDAPRAPEFLSQMLGNLVLQNLLPMQEIGQLLLRGGEEPGHLVKVGLAGDVLGSVMEVIKLDKGDSTLDDVLRSSGIRLQNYLPPHPLRSKRLELFICEQNS